MTSGYLENERVFSADGADYLVIMSSLCAYRENKTENDGRG